MVHLKSYSEIMKKMADDALIECTDLATENNIGMLLTENVVFKVFEYDDDENIIEVNVDAIAIVGTEIYIMTANRRNKRFLDVVGDINKDSIKMVGNVGVLNKDDGYNIFHTTNETTRQYYKFWHLNAYLNEDPFFIVRFIDKFHECFNVHFPQ